MPNFVKYFLTALVTNDLPLLFVPIYAPRDESIPVLVFGVQD